MRNFFISLIPEIDLRLGDYTREEIIEYLKNSTQVEVISFGKSTSSKLREICEDFVDMCDAPEKFIINHRGIRNTRSRSKNKKKKIIGQ